MGAILIIRLTTAASGENRTKWKDGEIVNVSPDDVPLGNKVQVETGNFFWLNIIDRTPEELAYLLEPWTYDLRFEELAGGNRLRFTLNNPAGSPELNFDEPLVQNWLDNTPKQEGTALTIFNITNTAFTINASYGAGDRPNSIGNAVVFEASRDVLSRRKWTVTTAGMAQIRNSDYVWQDGSGTTGGRLDGTFNDLQSLLLDKSGG